MGQISPAQHVGIRRGPPFGGGTASRQAERREAEAAAQAAGFRRVGAGLVLLALLLLCLLLSLHPHYLYLNGQRIPLGKIGTAADGARLLGVSLAPGNRVDVQGGVLVQGGGRPAVLLCNGEPVAPEAVVRGGDCLTVVPPRDVREPVTTRVRMLAPALSPAAARAAEAAGGSPGLGLRRVEIGQYSGKLVVETTEATPVVIPASSRKRIALTFDDGPSPTYTPPILAILKKNGAHATFFELGICAIGHKDVQRAVFAAGHEIGVHSWDHPQLTKLSADQVREQLTRTMSLFHAICGPGLVLRWMRPPYGSTNARVKAIIESVGLKQILWGPDTEDWKRPGADVIYQRLMSGASNGAIILCHDGGGPREGTVEAVRRAVPDLIARGYELVTVSQLKAGGPSLTGEVTYTVNGETYTVTPVAGATVYLDGAPLDYDGPLLQCRGRLLVPAVPTFRRLGTTCQYDAATQSLRLTGPTGDCRIRLDSLRIEKNGVETRLYLPALLYRGHAYVPLWAIMNLTTGQALWKAQKKTLWLYSPGVSLTGAGPPETVGAQWVTGEGMEN
jgi:peptidoglycan/xylan/chitin deacetylase (PgdA/CDA1 family)